MAATHKKDKRVLPYGIIYCIWHLWLRKYLIVLLKLTMPRLLQEIKKNRHRSKYNDENAVLHVEYVSSPFGLTSVEVLDIFKVEAQMPLPKVIDLMSTGYTFLTAGDGYFIKAKNCLVRKGSDILLFENQIAYWGKSRSILFDRVIPLDNDFISRNGQSLVLKKAEVQETIECGYSLLGATGNAWGHFLLQYFPKLQFLDNILGNHDVVDILIPDPVDAHIEALVLRYIAGKNTRLKRVKSGEAIKCKTLYYSDSTSYLSDHVEDLIIGDTVIPDFSIGFLKAQIALLEIQPDTQRRKIYLRRDGYRGVLNSAEIDSELEKRGYEICYPHTLPFEEKIKYFRSASVIVGPLSSGFANMAFCSPGTIALALMNTARARDSFVVRIAEAFKIDFMTIIGHDVIPGGIHSDCTIDMPRFIRALDMIDAGLSRGNKR